MCLDRQTDRWAGRQAGRQTDGQAGRQADRQMGRQADGCVDDNWIGGNKKREVRVGYEQLLKFRLYAHLHRVWYYWHFDTEIYHYVSECCL